jgi:hypothetical protein
MELTRKEFLEFSGRAAAGMAALSTWDLLSPAAVHAKEAIDSPEVRKIHDRIAALKAEHIRKVQEDLRQPSVSSWNMGVR